jgi:hypothetical protein
MKKRKVVITNRDFCNIVKAGIERTEKQMRTCMLKEGTREEVRDNGVGGGREGRLMDGGRGGDKFKNKLHG